MIDPRLVDISEYAGEGCHPLVDTGEWQRAILRCITEQPSLADACAAAAAGIGM